MASVSGVALDAGDRKPVAGVNVQLLREERNPIPFGATTDEQGRFSFPAIPAGEYAIIPRRTGMVFCAFEADHPIVPSVILRAGQQAQLRVCVIHKAVISGRVVDDSGVGVDSAYVDIESATGRAREVSFFREHYQMRARIRTDDRGEYRMSVPPGSYYVKATLNSGHFAVGLASNGAAFSETYFPSATNKKAAQQVETQAGRETANINIMLGKVRTYTISGMVTGTGPGYVTVSAVANLAKSWQPATPDSSGRFAIKNLVPGTYNVFAQNQRDDVRVNSASVEVRLIDRDITDLNLVLGAMVRVSGHIEATGDTGALRVALQPVFFASGAELKTSEIDAKGNFEIDKVPADRYKFVITSKAHNSYVARLVSNGEVIVNRLIDLSKTGESVKIAAAVAIGAHVSGKVTRGDAVVTGRTAGVVLDPVDKKPPMDRTRRSLAKGSYGFDGVPPGKYRIIAIDPVTGGSDEELEAALARGEIVEVTGTEDVVKDLRIDAKAVNPK